MARDILGEFGPESPQHQKPRATHGGTMPVQPTRYHPPQGPIGIDHKGVGLGGVNHGNCGTQGPNLGAEHDTGHPGIGPVSHGNKGSQR